MEDSLLYWLKHAANELISSESRTYRAPLRVLQETCEFDYLRNKRSDQRFLQFFLAEYIDHMFYNLSGELPDNAEVEKMRKAFLQEMGSRLQELHEGVRDGNKARQLETMESMVAEYLDTINEINNIYDADIRRENHEPSTATK